jgi:hypothetical protein
MTGRTPSTTTAREVAVCLQQGRLFFQSAEAGALEIKPLLLFYGTMAFSKALIVSKTSRPLATMPHTHGVTDVSGSGTSLAKLTVRIGTSGTFQQFNDVVAPLNRLNYRGHSAKMPQISVPAALSSELDGLTLTLPEILSRVPGLGRLYRQTFEKPALTDRILLWQSSYDSTYWILQIYDLDFSDRNSMATLVQGCRQRYPVLTKWRVVRADRDGSFILFGNVPVPLNELDEATLPFKGSSFDAKNNPEHDASIPRVPIEKLLSSVGGSTDFSTSLIAPVQGLFISEYSLQYIAMFLLSSLVRYRPQTWGHAITRTFTAEQPADDRALALIEEFMSLHSSTIPELVAELLNPQR